MSVLPTFKHHKAAAYCENQKRRQHMLANMIHDCLPWYESEGEPDKEFQDIVRGMHYGAIANAIEECTADELAEFIQLLAKIIDESEC